MGVRSLILCLVTLLGGCAAKHQPHPVQPTPENWRFRAKFKNCMIGETIYGIPLEVGGKMRTVTIMDCPTGIKVVDHYTGEDVTPK